LERRIILGPSAHWRFTGNNGSALSDRNIDLFTTYPQLTIDLLLTYPKISVYWDHDEEEGTTQTDIRPKDT
jgi:hypothetical protein